jgi:hypothetical protein
MNRDEDLNSWLSLIGKLDMDRLSWIRGHIQKRLDEIGAERKFFAARRQDADSRREAILREEQERLEKIREKLKSLP